MMIRDWFLRRDKPSPKASFRLSSPMLEPLEPRLLLDSSGLWHQVETDGNIYNINLSTTGAIEDLRGHRLTAAHFDRGQVTRP